MEVTEGRVDELVQQAKQDQGAAAKLLMMHRSYLMVLARGQISRRLEAKASASDVVQETLLEAHRAIGSFSGGSEAEFLGWLRKILSSRIIQLLRRYTTEKRDHRLEERFQLQLDQSGDQLSHGLVAQVDTPSCQAAQRESAAELAEALESIAPDYREVVILHHVEGLPFDEVARRMGKTPGGAQKLWIRALGKLRHTLRDQG